MTANLDRATECATMLLAFGDRWIPKLPHDAALRHDRDGTYALLGGVAMRRRVENGQAWWELREGLRRAVVVPETAEITKLREWGVAR